MEAHEGEIFKSDPIHTPTFHRASEHISMGECSFSVGGVISPPQLGVLREPHLDETLDVFRNVFSQFRESDRTTGNPIISSGGLLGPRPVAGPLDKRLASLIFPSTGQRLYLETKGDGRTTIDQNKLIVSCETCSPGWKRIHKMYSVLLWVDARKQDRGLELG
jgi:hypothetical protein